MRLWHSSRALLCAIRIITELFFICSTDGPVITMVISKMIRHALLSHDPHQVYFPPFKELQTDKGTFLQFCLINRHHVAMTLSIAHARNPSQVRET